MNVSKSGHSHDLGQRVSGEIGWVARVDVFVHRYRLSPKERELVIATVQGKDLSTCAEQIGCSVGTVKTHWCRIFAKTRMRSRRDVIAGVLRCCD